MKEKRSGDKGPRRKEDLKGRGDAEGVEERCREPQRARMKSLG